MTFFQCFAGAFGSSDLLSADVRGSRPKATERGMKAIIALLYSMRCASSLQCRPPPCVPLRAHLAGAPSLPCEVSARGCGALETSTLSSSLPPSCCGKCTHVAQALPLCLLLLSKRKAKMPQHATRIAQHALRNTNCATQHAKTQQRAERAHRAQIAQGQTRQGERSKL